MFKLRRSSSPPAIATSPAELADRLKLGTLQYTMRSMFVMGFWLLWGNFSLGFLELVIPPILPLKLQEWHASNTVMFILMNAIPQSINFVVNPIMGVRTDRYRSRWGRRIPFLFWTAPPVTLFVILMAFSPEIGRWLQAHVAGRFGTVTTDTMIVGTVGVFLAMFQFFNMFMVAVNGYLFNDVVPRHYIARFSGIFSMVGQAIGMAFNFFLFQYAKTNMREIFVGAALLYFVSFMLMCWRVKEGEYPPPPPVPPERGTLKGYINSIKSYCRESFTHRFYLYTFGLFACIQAASACGPVKNLFYLHLGISLKQLGHFRTYLAIPSLVFAYPLAWLADRLHPVRLVFWSMLFMPVGVIVSYFVVHDYRTMVIMALVALPDEMFFAMAMAPLAMMIWPRERFGQVASANTAVRASMFVVMSVVAGLFMDFMKGLYHGNEEYYRWMYIWTAAFYILAFVFMFQIYRYWKRHGGAEHFVPPPLGTVAATAEPKA